MTVSGFVTRCRFLEFELNASLIHHCLLAICLMASVAVIAMPSFAQGAPSTTLAEKAEESQVNVDEMRSMMKEAFTELENARSEEDLPRLTCVREVVTAMKGLLRLAEENILSLRDSVARKNGKGTEHEAMKINIASDKFRKLHDRARSCGAPDMTGTIDGKPSIEKIFDGDLPLSDPVDDFKAAEVLLERPVSASQFY